MKLETVALAACLASSATAFAQGAPQPPPQPLRSSVGTVFADPELRLAIANSGANAQARYRSENPGWYPAGEPLVLLVHGANLDVPDQVKVTKAEISGNDIVISLEVRHLTGPHACTMCLPPMAPLVEVQLGALARGDYRVVVEHVELDYADENHPELATKGRTWKDGRSFLVIPPPAPPPRMP
jgi:hypothetical protein